MQLEEIPDMPSGGRSGNEIALYEHREHRCLTERLGGVEQQRDVGRYPVVCRRPRGQQRPQRIVDERIVSTDPEHPPTDGPSDRREELVVEESTSAARTRDRYGTPVLRRRQGYWVTHRVVDHQLVLEEACDEVAQITQDPINRPLELGGKFGGKRAQICLAIEQLPEQGARRIELHHSRGW